MAELIVYPCSGVRPSYVRRRTSTTFSNMNISAIKMKFYQKHHLGWGESCIRFWARSDKTLVSMATDISYRVIMEKTVLPLFLSCFSSDPFYIILAGKDDIHGSSEDFEIQPDPTTDCGVSSP